MKLKVLTRFGEMGASSRMRAFQYLPYLKAAGIDVEIVPLFLNQDLQAVIVMDLMALVDWPVGIFAGPRRF